MSPCFDFYIHVVTRSYSSRPFLCTLGGGVYGIHVKGLGGRGACERISVYNGCCGQRVLSLC